MNEEDTLIIPDSKREAVIRELKRIEKQYGMIRPEVVVERAQSKDNVLHEYFEWDKVEAAYKYQLQQARMLINQIRVEIKERWVKPFQHVRVEIADGGVQKGYVSVERVLSDEALFKQKRRDLLSRLEYWTQEAAQFDELRGLVSPKKIETVKKRLQETAMI